MAVSKTQVSNWQQAIDYMKGSAVSAAGGVCPGASSVYSSFIAAYDVSMRQGGWFDKQTFLSDLASADAACKASPDYAPKVGIPTAPAGSTSAAPKVDPSTGGAAPDVTIVPAAIGAGLPWWVWLLGGGAVLYMLFGKKGKKGKK